MSMILYGTAPSPFVRRIRVLLEGVDCRFEEVGLYEDAGRQQFARISPVRKVPVLVDGDQTIFDSHVIYQYLQRKLALPELTLAQHNLISVVDAVTDSFMVILMSQRSGIPVDSDQLLFKLQQERIEDSLAWLEQQASAGCFEEWDFPTMCLATAIEWLHFRGLHNFSQQPALMSTLAQYRDLPIMQSTRPE